MAEVPSFAKLVPGFEFLQGLVKNASATLPSIGQWVAPTLNPEELEKRIGELRTVQFWLEQNARMLGATIQALEVQRMTLSTLKTMNVQMEDLRDSLQIRLPTASAPAPSPAPAPTAVDKAKPPAPVPTPAIADESKAETDGAAATPAAAPRAGAATTGAVDPMQWWGALTKQFTQLAASAMKETANEVTGNLAGKAMKKSFDAATAKLAKAASSGATAAAPASSRAARKTPSPARKRAAPRRTG